MADRRSESTSNVISPIPEELKTRSQWVCWRYEMRAGRTTKVPIDPKGGDYAKSNDRASWGGFDEAWAAVERYGCKGVGFVFTLEDPYAGIDLDDCIDGNGALGNTAREIVDLFATYTEVSPSGKGLHLILRGKLPAGAPKQAVLDGQKVEVYSEGRFFCMTGEVWS